MIKNCMWNIYIYIDLEKAFDAVDPKLLLK